MKITEIVALIKQEKPKLVDAAGEQNVVGLLREAFAQIAKLVEKEDAGVVRIPALGGFSIRVDDREKDGKSVSVRTVRFRPATATPGKNKKGETGTTAKGTSAKEQTAADKTSKSKK